MSHYCFLYEKAEMEATLKTQFASIKESFLFSVFMYGKRIFMICTMFRTRKFYSSN